MTRPFFSALFCAILVLSAVLDGLMPAQAAIEKSSKTTKQILFVCTGNFYRSRFAEALFNEQASRTNLQWKAISRGLALVSSQQGISPLALEELQHRGVPEELCKGTPEAITQKDLDKSDYIVLMDEKEHRAMFEKQFPKFNEAKIHYWHIPDGRSNCTKACEVMTKNIEELFQTLPR